MTWLGKRVRNVCSVLRLCLFAILLTNTLVATSGASSPVWKRMNITLPTNHQWPLSRSEAAVWLGPSLKYVWMFGGRRADNKSVVQDDFWKLDLAMSKWTEIQQQGPPLPGRRRHAVMSRGPNGVLLTGGITSNSIQGGDVWQYNFQKSSWRVNSRQDEALGNTTRFWSNGTDLFGVTLHNSSSIFMLQYNVTEQKWMKFAIHNISRSLPSRLAPDLKNLTHYPLWPSGDDYVVIYAPVKNYRIIIDAKEKKSQQPCVLWILTKSLEWRPFVNDCELYKTCPSVLPSSLRTVEVIHGLPECRTHSASWMDAEGNLWVYGGLSRNGTGLQDTWRFSRRTRSWKQVNTPCTDIGSSADCQDFPGQVLDAMTWRVNSTLFLLGGRLSSDSVSAAFLKQLWTFDLSDYSDRSSLAVPPVGIFLIVLSAMVILSLVSCGIIIFAKCSSPLAPRIRPPRRMYGKVHYSPVNSTDEP